MSNYRSIEKILIRPDDSIRQAADCINRNREGLAALVVDENRQLLDVVTDGDIRRAILNGLDLDMPVSVLRERKHQTASTEPIFASDSLSKEDIYRIMQTTGVTQIPIVDNYAKVIDLAKLSDFIPDEASGFQAVVMAGGFGTRLLPLTTDTPKPMLPVGDRPLLEITIENLKSAGIRQVNVTTHFLPDKIKGHFGDGSKFGIDINYVDEGTPLGTAGALSMMSEISEPLLVINGDILTRIDFKAMLAFHREHEAGLTVAVRKYDVKVPFGVMDCSGATVTGVREKPTMSFFVSAGIYLLEPSLCKLIKPGVRLDMPDFINELILSQHKVVSFPVVEYWLDIGQHVDYAQAQMDIKSGLLNGKKKGDPASNGGKE